MYHAWKNAENDLLRTKQNHEKNRAQGRIPTDRLGYSLSQIAEVCNSMFVWSCRQLMFGNARLSAELWNQSMNMTTFLNLSSPKSQGLNRSVLKTSRIPCMPFWKEWFQDKKRYMKSYLWIWFGVNDHLSRSWLLVGRITNRCCWRELAGVAIRGQLEPCCTYNLYTLIWAGVRNGGIE